MQTIIYNKDTKKIVKVIKNGRVNEKTVRGDDGSCQVGDAGLIIQVPDNTVKVKFIEDIEVFTPEKISTKWIAETPPKTLEDRIKDLEKDVKTLKEKKV